MLTSNEKNTSNYMSLIKKTSKKKPKFSSKNHLYIENIFDEKGAKKFLESKEIALMEMKLDDNIEQVKKSPSKKESKKKSIIAKKKTISPRKNKRKSKKRVKLESNLNTCDSKNEKYYTKIDKIDLDNSNIYKFIIENANDSDDSFMEKLDKEVKRVRTSKIIKNYQNTYKNKDNINKIHRSSKSYKKLIPFIFDEKAKNLMTNEDFKVSAISREKTTIPDSLFNKNSKNNINKNQDIIEKKSTIKYSYIEEQESIISILYDLVQ